MRNPILPVLTAALLMFGGPCAAVAHPELNAFPEAKPGMERCVVVLPHKERGEEDAFRVELLVGKEMPKDGVNRVRLSQTIQPRNLPRWGYTYYEVTSSGEAISTLMAPAEGTPPVRAYVTGAPLLIPYNSRPVVVYIPEGYQVRYRIWQASETTEAAQKG